jgi:branched-chain amino acid transport system substrate-binding protein
MEGGADMNKTKVFLFAGFLLGIMAIGAFLIPGASPVAAAPPKGAPAKLKVGFVDFFSGTAAVFGIGGKYTSEWLVKKWNGEGGIRGVPIDLVIVDEAGGTKKQVTEYRRLVLEEKVHAVIGYTSSGNCLGIAPVAEELKTLTVAHICGTHRLTEDFKLKYVFRTSNNQAADSVLLARYVMKVMPDVKSIAGINDDYAWGRDCWAAFKGAMQSLKPGIKIKAVLWPKLFKGEYSAEISRLLATKADVIHSSLWGGHLMSFIKQAAPRGLFKKSLVLLSTAESVTQALKKDMPEGVVALPRVTAGYFLDPDPATDPMQKEYVEGYYKDFGRYPDYPSYRTYQAWAGFKAAYEKAIDILGRWPTTEEVIKAFEGLAYKVPGGIVTMRPDHQAVHGGLIGVTKMSKEYGFTILVDRVRISGEDVMPPLGVKTLDWVKTLK